MRVLKAIFTVVVMSSLLAGCGGDSNDEPELVPEILCSAYDKIQARMTYDQVKNIVGRDHDSVKVYGTTPQYTWNHSEKDRFLNVSIGDKGVDSKSLVNLCGGGTTKYLL